MAFQSSKEIIWHITCSSCKFYFTLPTMEEKYMIDRGQLHCPGCGKKQGVKIIKRD